MNLDWISIIFATAAVGCVGLLIGILLGIAAKKLSVEENPVLVKVREALPNNNCGGCGYAGCAELAAAIVEGKASTSACPVGGSAVASNISSILGVDSEFVKKTAFVTCQGSCSATNKDYTYYGEKSCELMDYVPGKGEKKCSNGCIGFGSCVKVCEYDALSVIDGVAVVDSSKCVACGKCTEACPKNLIKLIPVKTKVIVACSSNDIGKNVMKACNNGCIGCKKCERSCPKGAIKVTDNLPVIDYDLCVGCGLCVKDCPKNVLIKK